MTNYDEAKALALEALEEHNGRHLEANCNCGECCVNRSLLAALGELHDLRGSPDALAQEIMQARSARDAALRERDEAREALRRIAGARPDWLERGDGDVRRLEKVCEIARTALTPPRAARGDGGAR